MTFVVVEGVDGAGKSALINCALELQPGWMSSRGFMRETRLDAMLHSHPHSAVYYLDMAAKTARQIRPALRDGKTVLQDRYVQTVDSYPPDCDRWYNKAVRQALGPLFLAPDVYVHVTACFDEIVRRLSENPDGYHASLVKQPSLIEERMQRYQSIFDRLRCPKYVIDTTGRAASDAGRELVDVVRRSTCS